MNPLAILFVMLSAFFAEMGASTYHWQRQQKLPRKIKHDYKGCGCLNGGTCLTYGLFSRIKSCVCPEGYNGDHCEIDVETRCYTGDGTDYRGTESENENGETCLSWDSHFLKRWPYSAHMENSLELGLGRHNHCRNPNGSSKPWCYVRKGYRTSVTPCDVPMCQNGRTCGQRNLSKNFKIVGGQTAPIESQPWIATIFHSRGNQFFCGGSLIDPCWVLTAAHCFSDTGSDTSRFIVRLGRSATNASNPNDQEFRVERLIIHEAFSKQTRDYNNDIALIKIRSSSGQCAKESAIVKTICLPSENLMLRDRSHCEVSGYGKQQKTAIYYSRVLKSASVQLIPQATCKRYYESHKVTENMLCASDSEWKSDSCSGDSGGPLTCMSNSRMVLYGIVSWGDGCAKEGKPGVYTRVSRYIPWIDSNMNRIHFRSFYPPK
ncbi:urokinase-type plasminogen activator [Ahaetulla prasina]|uniref:urokinase-type plasminogen activator n=1 Tax=Ahaetulla prasina TaxID=499056 RepID=UPI0026478A88|nr:urokinase-type plasminogen activator [Ahaetulla prasina]XP_058044773.1 urokinase-type plasminogen activator [Ahaetulla prasina]